VKIITAPHPSLRQKAVAVKTVDKKLQFFINDLQSTLLHQSDPPGVGLAAPQVDKKYRIFCTLIAKEPRVFINPVINKASEAKILGENPQDKDYQLEGCLSIPQIYGPVPRSEWISLEYDVVVDQKLQRKSESFSNFPARVIQHELDHLNGILFTDYLLQYDLPAYQIGQGEKLLEIEDRKILEIF